MNLFGRQGSKSPPVKNNKLYVFRSSAASAPCGEVRNVSTKYQDSNAATRIVSSGLYSSHSPGLLLTSRLARIGSCRMPYDSAVPAFSAHGVGKQAISTDTTIRIAVVAMLCHRKSVCVSGISPLMLNNV